MIIPKERSGDTEEILDSWKQEVGEAARHDCHSQEAESDKCWFSPAFSFSCCPEGSPAQEMMLLHLGWVFC